MKNQIPNKHQIPSTQKSKSIRAFTLLEIIVVLALIAAIAGLVIANLDKIFGGGKESVAKIWVKQIDTPLMAYRIQMGNYPTTEQGLQALLTPPAGQEKRWKGPYIKELPEDPWNHPYQYRYPGTKNPSSYDVWSLGPNGVEDEEVIGNWQK